uniref:(northern house mosquito) hypothetical protein n=1 Tax=Culex pipiens TaxID=7175 RepID=A0A8D8ADM8_CULPI
MHSPRHHAGDGRQREGLQAHQAPGSTRSSCHREAREAAEAGSGAQTSPEAPGVPRAGPPARQGLQGVPPEQRRQGRSPQQGHHELPRERRTRTEEGTGAHREGTYAAVDGRGRGGLPQAYRSEERQTVGVPAVANGRVHREPHGDGEAAQGRPEEDEGRRGRAQAAQEAHGA